jgi:hypothetical protein
MKRVNVSGIIMGLFNARATRTTLTFSGLTCTTAASPTDFTILLARVLNAPHCLQASIVTIFFEVVGASALFFLVGGAFFAAGAAFFLAGDDAAFPEERVVRAIIGTILTCSI